MVPHAIPRGATPCQGRLTGAAALLVVWAASIANGQSFSSQHPLPSGEPVVFVQPGDPNLAYSEYVNADVIQTRARFDRTSVTWTGNLHSPGTRVNFSTDGTPVRLWVNYRYRIPKPGNGIFRLEVDDRLLERGFGSDTDIGVRSYPLIPAPAASPSLGRTPSRRRDFSLVLPYGCAVDFLGLQVEGGTRGPLGPPPTRPSFLYVAHGDSITHGFDGSSTANGYPYRVARRLGWSVVNMGFFGRKIVATDGTAVGSLGADWVSVAIGINDYFGEGGGPTTAIAFRERYNTFLDNVRALQPSVPVFAITPTWTSSEGVPNAIGMTPEDYRQEIRTVVSARTPTDPQLYLVEGLGLVPPGPAFFPDGIHPNDAGFLAYASALEALYAGVLALRPPESHHAMPVLVATEVRGAAGGAPALGAILSIDRQHPLGRPTAAALLFVLQPSAHESRAPFPSTARFPVTPSARFRAPSIVRDRDLLLQAIPLALGIDAGPLSR